jgi:beta-N-acetylhexosaminidase
MPSLDAECASLLAVGFAGTAPSAEVKELLRRGVSGAVLFGRNVESAEQVAALSAALKREAGRPLLLSVDQEGGRVMRLRARHGFTELPPMRALGAAGDEGLAFEVGALLGSELRAAGIDQDYAPVADVDTNPANPVIGDRSLSRDPDSVARLAAALARGLQSAGVAACGKHFPGHGDTAQDSHRELPRLPHALPRLRAVELPPFAALARAGAAAVMTAHVVFEALDPSRPATMSPAALGLLRGECGFRGAVLSDDLEMKAVSAHFPIEEAVPAAVNAGVDLLLVCHRAEVQHAPARCGGRWAGPGLAGAARRGAGPGGQLLRFAGPPPDPRAAASVLRTARHLALAARLTLSAA